MVKIVVIEDEIDLRRMIVEELEDLGHEVHEAVNGEEGLRKIEQVKPQVICSDINMPKMNGFEMKEALDTMGLIDEKTVFIFISANSTKVDIADGLMVGAAHYFTKPIDFDRLASVLEKLPAAA